MVRRNSPPEVAEETLSEMRDVENYHAKERLGKIREEKTKHHLQITQIFFKNIECFSSLNKICVIFG
jgi:hypothetical protein